MYFRKIYAAENFHFLKGLQKHTYEVIYTLQCKITSCCDLYACILSWLTAVYYFSSNALVNTIDLNQKSLSMVQVSYKFNTTRMSHTWCFVSPHRSASDYVYMDVQECTCTYKSVHAHVDYTCIVYWAIDTQVSVVITIISLQMAVLCKRKNLLNHWFISTKQSQDCIPLLNSYRIIIFSNSAIGLYSSVNQSSDIRPTWHQHSSAKQHCITFFRNVTNYTIS